MKVLSVVGTRPELIKLSMVLKKLDDAVDKHVFVHTGQNFDYELNEIFYKDLGLRKPDYFLNVAGTSLGDTIGNVFKKVEEVLVKEKPDAVVILGDTNSALAGIMAKRLKIPLFHLEAGNRCFDDNVPEEINRRILDHIADVNMVYSENQRLYLLSEGISKDRLFVSGSPMREVYDNLKFEVSSEEVLEKYEVEAGEYLLVSLHRDENMEIEKNFNQVMHLMNALAKKYNLPVIVSTHPRTRKKMEAKELVEPIHSLVKYHKPFGFCEFLILQQNAKCVISDSGTIAEESAILNFPAITIRNAIERPEALDVGSIIMSGLQDDDVFRCVDTAIKQNTKKVPSAYSVDNFSERVINIILGYTSYVNRVVWKK